MDDDGYCTNMLFSEAPFEDGVREVHVEGRKCYQVKVCNGEDPDELAGYAPSAQAIGLGGRGLSVIVEAPHRSDHGLAPIEA